MGPAARTSTMLLLAFALSGCFTSQEPLILPEDAAFPYTEVVFHGEDEDEAHTLRRDGDAYLMTGEDGSARVRFLPVGENEYIAQAIGRDGDGTLTLYAFVKVDPAAMTAGSYLAIAPRGGIDGAGFSSCNDGMVCIEDLDAYIGHAREQIAAGRRADLTYTLISME